MRETSVDYATLTLTLPKPKDALKRVCLALTHQAKNLHNTTLFLVRQVMSAYDYDAKTELSTLKLELHPEQIAVIAHVNAQIESINAKREVKHPAQVAKALAAGKPAPKLQLLALLTAQCPDPLYTMLDATVLDNAARHWPGNAGEAVYKRLPGAMAQQVVATLKDCFSSFFKALTQFKAGSSDMTGRPGMPNYMAKNERAVLEIPLVHVFGALPKVTGKRVPEDYRETSVLTDDVLAAFSNFDILAQIDAACKKRGWTDFKPQHLRIVPTRNGVKMEVVVRVPNAYPEESFLAGVLRAHGATLALLKKQKDRDAWMLKHLKDMPLEAMPRIASIDLGVSNLAAVAYSTGHKAEVHSGGRFDAVVGPQRAALAKLVSDKSTPRAKELQSLKNALKEKDELLSKADHWELNSLLKAVYAEPAYLTRSAKNSAWTNNYLHNLSHHLVQSAQNKRVDVIIIGRNKGWKSGTNLGRVQNGRFGAVAHAKLIDFIRYKAELVGIAVVTVEESYTSKTSFVNNEILEVFDEATRADKSIPRPVKTGKRSSDRNWFAHKTPMERWSVVHADVNGAFNIIRKVFVNFRFHLKLTLKFTLFRLSPRLGVVPL
jgi:putative transposase